MGDKKRTTVVRGYRELHNSWPSHNRAAQGCERADGMSFSFVSRRGDYFSFHSFVPRFLCLPPFSLSPLFSSAHLLSPSVFLAPFLSHHRARDPPYPTVLSFAHAARPRFILECRVIKLLFYAMRARNYERKGDLTGPVSST